ncbi:MAG: DMT family transporter [Clostridium sp.]
MVFQVIVLLIMFLIISGASGIGFYMFKDGVNYFSIAFLILSIASIIFLIIKHFIIGKNMRHRKLNIVDMLRFMITFILVSITISSFLYDSKFDIMNLEITYIISAAVLTIVIIWRIYDRVVTNNMNKRKKTTFNTITILPGIIMMSITYLSFFKGLKTGLIFLGVSLIFMLISIVIMINSYPKGVLKNYKNDPIKKTGNILSIINFVVVVGIILAAGIFVYNRFINLENIAGNKVRVSIETLVNNETSSESRVSVSSDTVKDEEENKEDIKEDNKQIYQGTLYNSWNDDSKIECIEGNSFDFIKDGVMINDNHKVVLNVDLKNSYKDKPEDFRTKIMYDNGEVLNLSSYIDKYLIFDIFNESEGAEGSPFVALRDSKGNQIAGWCENFTADSFKYDNKIESGKWKTICVDLLNLQKNTTKENGIWKPENFDFNSITCIWIGYWAKGNIYIDNITFSDVIP